MKIEKKVRKESFEKIMSGVINTEMRIADFECTEGDTIVFKEWNPETQEFTGREVEKEIVSLAKGSRPRPWTEENIEKFGFYTISFK